MITIASAPLVPDWVHDGFFPEADEEQLAALGGVWKKQGDQAQQHSEDLDRQVRTLMASYSGDAADAASAHVDKVRKFLESTGSSCHSLAECCEKAAQLVTFAKTSINVVVLALQVQSEKLEGSSGSSGNLVTKVVTVVKLRQLQIAAQAKIKAIHDAVEKRIAELAPKVDIEPRLTVPAGTTSPFAPGSPRTLFNRDKVNEVAERQGIPLPGAGQNGSGTPGHPTAATTGPGGTGPGDEGQDGTGPDDTDVDLTDPTTLFDPGTAVGAENEQGPSPDSEDPTTVSDGAVSDEEQAALENEVDQQIEAGNTSIDYDGTDLADGATTIDRSEFPDSFPDEQPGAGGGPAGVVDVEGDGTGSSSADVDVVTGTDPGARPGPGNAGASAAVSVEAGGDPGHAVPSGSDDGSSDQGGSSYDPGPSHTPAPSYGPRPSYDPGPSYDPRPSYDPGPSHDPGPSYDPGPSGGSAPDLGHDSGGSGGGDGSSSSEPRNPGTSAAGYTRPTQPPPGAVAPGPGPLPGGSGGPSLGPVGSGPAPGAGLGSTGGPAPAPAPPVTGGLVGGAAPPPPAAPTAPVGPALTTSTHPIPPAQPTPPANVTAQAAPPVGQQQPTVPPTAKQVPPGATAPHPDRIREPVPPTTERIPARTGMAGAAVPLGAAGLAPLFGDLRQRTPAPQDLTSALTLLPTQFGPDDVPLAALPPSWGVPYQKVLLPGEADAYLSGQVTTVRGLLHPYDQVRDLTTPAELHAMLGLGFAVGDGRGGTELAFDPAADGIEVMRFAGIPGGDLVIPVSEGTDPGTGSSIRPMVRHHARPWSGGGVAPGSSEDRIVEEFEVLGELGVPVPHLAEIWRVYADGSSEHLGTHNARTGLWRRTTVSAPPVGVPLPHGPQAVMPDGARFSTVMLNDHEHVLVDRTGHAPDFFTDAPDGSHRHVVASDQITAVVGIATIGTWRGARVLVLQQVGDQLLVDHIGDDPQQAAALGLRQLGQGQWQQIWVPAAEVVGVRTWERSYPPLPVTPNRPVAPAPASVDAG